ncbi:hypothetical protein [Streptomyces jumonjinensis]|uniref:Uncharacterized protein n=1 Tax=Streptomyces jumonjinensis TaxID=1945 RepID=A0A646KLE7_STRJU|nr:hypothetical protein [Streptomyces jumonjinensis]MQT03139.1 hypothetical protein [Streptomyces jumonjinensis]
MITTPGMRELTHWISHTTLAPDPAAAAQRLYDKIAIEVTDVEALRLRAELTTTQDLRAARAEVHAYQALCRSLIKFAHGRDDDTAKRVYTTIARFNLGEMFRPGGGADRYLIPVELLDTPATDQPAETGPTTPKETR